MSNHSIIFDRVLLQYFDECIKIFEELNIYLPRPLRLVSGVSTHWLGQAHYRDNKVVLNRYILQESEAAIKTVMLHELGHLAANWVEPGCGHRGAWRRIIAKISKVTGYNITRLSPLKNYPEFAEHCKPRNTYKFMCPSCKGTLVYHKQTQFVKTFDVKKADGSPAWWCRRCEQTLHKRVAFIKI